MFSYSRSKTFCRSTLPLSSAKTKDYSKFSPKNFPITDSRENFVLEFIDYVIDPPKYSVDECIDRGLTYSVPLKAKLRLSCNDEDNEEFETIEQEVFLGNIPYMTNKGSFVINGAERVIVSQLHRSPGVFFCPKQAHQRYQALLGPDYSFQRFLDRICHGRKQRDVRLHRP